MKPVWRILLAIVLSAIGIALAMLIIIQTMTGDIGLSAGTACTCVLPGCAQAALCLWIYRVLG